jgi:ATP citrate (pro-S)-lyase
MNTIVVSRAEKDLISSLASGLLTLSNRFGGALDEAVSMFSNARDTRPTPREFVDESWKANKLNASSSHLVSLSAHVLMVCTFMYYNCTCKIQYNARAE